MNVARVRWAIRAVLALGLGASTAANILHAADNPVSQAIAAWPPLALFLTIEIVGRIPVRTRHLAAARRLAAVVIAGIAAWVSYWHMVGVAVRYGETGASAYLLPLSVDGLVLVASICLVELSGQQVDSPAVQVDSTPVRVSTSPVFQYAKPIGPRPAPAAAPAARLSNAARVVEAHGQDPDATDGQLAVRLDVSTKTVRRYRPRTAPGHLNGRTPQLTP